MMLKGRASKVTRAGMVRFVVLGGFMAWAAIAAAQFPPQTPWAPNAGVPWAPSATSTWSGGTASIGVDPPIAQIWGLAITKSMSNGQSFSGLSFATPASRQSYALNFSSSALGTYYPNGDDRNNPGHSIQPVPGIKNVNNNSFVVASKVLSNLGSTPTTDPYDPLGTGSSNGNKLNIYGGGLYSPGTDAAIIAGNFVPAAGSTGITLEWRTRSPNEMKKGSSTSNQLPGNSGYLASDVVQMSGQQTGNDYVLQMSYSNELETPADQLGDITVNSLYLGVLNQLSGPSTWKNAVSGNVTVSAQTITGYTRTGLPIYGYITQPAVGAFAYQAMAGRDPLKPYLGSFQAFLTEAYTTGGPTHYYYEKSLDQLRGSWGVDTTTNTTWAVLNYGTGIFAVVPEPGTIGLLAGGMVCLAAGALWRRKALKDGKVTAPKNTRRPVRMAD